MRALANLGVYTLGSVFQAAISVLLLPIYIRYLTPAEYGVVSILLVLSSMVTLATGLGVPSGFYRLYFDGRPQELFATAASWRVSGTLVALAILWPLAGRVSELLFATDRYHHAVVYVGISVVVSGVQELIFLTLRLQQRARLFVAYSLIFAVSAVVLKYVFIVTLGRGVEGYWISQALAEAFVVCLLIVHLRLFRWMRRPNGSLLKATFKIGFPYTFSALGVWIIDSAGKLLMNFFLGSAAVGIYSLAARISSLFGVLLNIPLQLWWGPFAYERAARDGIDRFKELSRRFLELLLVAAVLGVCLVPLAGLVVGLFPGHREYQQAIPLVVFCATPLALQALSIGFGAQFTQAKKTHYTATGGMVASVTSVAANVVLLPLVGLAGAIIANIAAYAVWLAIYWRGGQRELPVDYDRRHIIRNATLFAVYILSLVGIILLKKDLYNIGWPIISVAAAAATILVNRNVIRPFLAEAWAVLRSPVAMTGQAGEAVPEAGNQGCHSRKSGKPRTGSGPPHSRG